MVAVADKIRALTKVVAQSYDGSGFAFLDTKLPEEARGTPYLAK